MHVNLDLGRCDFGRIGIGGSPTASESATADAPRRYATTDSSSPNSIDFFSRSPGGVNTTLVESADSSWRGFLANERSEKVTPGTRYCPDEFLRFTREARKYSANLGRTRIRSARRRRESCDRRHQVSPLDFFGFFRNRIPIRGREESAPRASTKKDRLNPAGPSIRSPWRPAMFGLFLSGDNWTQVETTRVEADECHQTRIAPQGPAT